MENGCAECAKLDDDKLCETCELGYLEATMEAAIHDYRNKVNEILNKESEVQNELSDSSS